MHRLVRRVTLIGAGDRARGESRPAPPGWSRLSVTASSTGGSGSRTCIPAVAGKGAERVRGSRESYAPPVDEYLRQSRRRSSISPSPLPCGSSTTCRGPGWVRLQHRCLGNTRRSMRCSAGGKDHRGPGASEEIRGESRTWYPLCIWREFRLKKGLGCGSWQLHILLNYGWIPTNHPLYDMSSSSPSNG